jgi:hypothetical protein
MPWLILGIAAVIGLIMIFRGVGGIDPKRAVKILLGIIVIAGGVVAIYFIATRGINALMFAAAMLLPFLLRARGVRQFMNNLRGPSPGQETGLKTRFLRMSLDHDSGVLEGTVLEGQFKGRRLGEMSKEDVQALLAECRVEDEQSASVVEAYLDRVYGAAWRGGEAQGGESEKRSPWAGGMTPDEAREVLGVSGDATEGQIKKAHHELMKKIHPDQGGSNYLASKINQAKETLLGE